MVDTTKLSPKEFVISMIFAAIFYTLMLCLFMHFVAPKKIDDCPRCKEAIARYKASKAARSNPDAETYNESLYNQGGGINPGFKNIVSKQANASAEPSARAYEKQLAEYRLRLAEERQRQLEIKRQQEKQAAEQRALIEQQMLERKKQQELQQQQLLEMQKAQAAQAANTGTQKSAGVQKTAQPAQQKTQIGKLKTSKLGESSFQKQKF